MWKFIIMNKFNKRERERDFGALCRSKNKYMSTKFYKRSCPACSDLSPDDRCGFFDGSSPFFTSLWSNVCEVSNVSMSRIDWVGERIIFVHLVHKHWVSEKYSDAIRTVCQHSLESSKLNVRYQCTEILFTDFDELINCREKLQTIINVSDRF